MILIKPYIGCNIHCAYCYENTLRSKFPPKMKYDLPAILARMEECKGTQMALHGGEILTLPKKDVETLLAKLFEFNGRTGIQTNATLIDDDYIAMFKKYKTGVGISWDGPDELSAFRPGTEKVGAIIEKLVKEKITVSVIVVVSRANADTKAKLEKLKRFVLHLNSMGITGGRINPCLDAPGYELPIKRLIEVYLDLSNFCMTHGILWAPIQDLIKGLKGEDRVCFFQGCDPFSTTSAEVILSDGSVSNCMRTNKEGILLRHPVYHKTRLEILERTPQEFGGCQGCPYWNACRGGCPTGAIDNDWRNRSYLCPLWKALYSYFTTILNFCGVTVNQPTQGTPVISGNRPHGDSPHGDSPHGDHSDAQCAR